jgi:hypothetical protein
VRSRRGRGREGVHHLAVVLTKIHWILESDHSVILFCSVLKTHPKKIVPWLEGLGLWAHTRPEWEFVGGVDLSSIGVVVLSCSTSSRGRGAVAWVDRFLDGVCKCWRWSAHVRTGWAHLWRWWWRSGLLGQQQVVQGARRGVGATHRWGFWARPYRRASRP